MTVNSYAIDPQQSFEHQRRILVQPAAPAPAQQQVIQNIQIPARRQQERNQSMNSYSSQGTISNGGQLPQIQVVPIDRLKVESDAVIEYQFEPIQTLAVMEEFPSPVQEEVQPESSDAAVEEPQQEQAEVAAEESAPDESETGAVEEPHDATQGAEQASLEIIEEHGRFVVLNKNLLFRGPVNQSSSRPIPLAVID